MENKEIPQTIAPEQQKDVQKLKKKKGLLRRIIGWIFKLLLLAIVVGAVLIGLALRLPEKWGLTKSAAEKTFEYTPDRASAREILAALEASGFSTKGMSLYVLPEKNSDQSAVYAVLDASKGFQLNASAEGDPFLDTLVALVRSSAAGNAQVASVAVEYRDPTGKSIISLGASTQTILDFADKKISREQFSQQLGAKVDLKNVVEASLTSF